MKKRLISMLMAVLMIAPLLPAAAVFAGAEEAINAAATNIAALLWLNGNCEYCEHGEKEEFSGANRWHCRLGNGIDCRPVWRGAATKASLPEIQGRADFAACKAQPRGDYVRAERDLGYP